MSTENGEKSPSKKTPSKKKTKRSKLRSEFDALHAEMEVAKYAVNHLGRSRKKISQQESKVRTIKRKSLEVEDAKESAVQTTHNHKRMRGSKAALEDDVIQGSLIFGANLSSKEGKDDNDGDSDYAESCQDDVDLEDGEEKVDPGEEGRYELYADELDIDIDEEEDKSDDESDTPRPSTRGKKSNQNDALSPAASAVQSRVKASSDKFSGKKIAKTMYKLKNFRSYKMAQKHGEALGAHARGLNVSAVDKLKDVAVAAPVAPQVYSSLGLVYESMLREEIGRANRQARNEELGPSKASQERIDADRAANMKERIKLAKKTFGSYHVAALLCKMDYSLWTRAGDAAITVANLHMFCLTLPPVLDEDVEEPTETVEGEETVKESISPVKKITTTEEYLKYHQSERVRWLEEAKEDFQTADNLRPPGISVPSKLAYLQMELGNLSEALTILTDLKTKSQTEAEKTVKAGMEQRTELERSFSAWLLYADLMLVIGHECKQWNRGIQTNENYMFRRWLRKYSSAFDWQERRFQALCMAFEAAAGTKSCKKLMEWVKERTDQRKANDGKAEVDKSRWQVFDSYEIDRRLQRQKSASESGEKDGSLDNGQAQSEEDKGKELAGEKDQSQEDKDKEVTDEIIQNIDAEASTSKSLVLEEASISIDALSEKFDQDRERLLVKNQSELSDFDKTTNQLNMKKGSATSEKRNADRKKLLISHRQSLLSLALKYQETKTKFRASRELENTDTNTDTKGKGLPLTGTCEAVCDIASQLVKQCLAMRLYHGGRLTCEAVSLYLKERAHRYEERIKKWRSFEERQAFNGKSVLQLDNEEYDTLENEKSEDDESVVILSDDEDFDSPGGEEVVLMMKKGVLTPELQVLYGLSLMSDEKFTFLATQMLRGVSGLDDHSKGYDLLVRHGNDDDSSLSVLRRAMAEPMNQLDAFGLISDVLKNMSKEEKWAEFLLPIFQDYLEKLEKDGPFDKLLESSARQTLVGAMKRSNFLKVIFSTFRMKLSKVKKMAKNQESSNKRIAYDLSMALIDDVYRSLNELWNTNSDGNPVPDTVEVLNILSSAFSQAITCMEGGSFQDRQNLTSFLEKMKVCVSLICHIDFNNLYASKSSFITESWGYFPIPSNWQNDEHSIMSRTAFNLCVGCNVSSFSGWEKDEFSLNLLKKNRKETYFGIHIQGGHVVGWLSKNNENRLSKLWDIVEILVPTLSSLDFPATVANARKVEWCQKALANLESNFKNIPIASFGEDSALDILLTFAHSALMLAQLEEDEMKTEALMKHALSIILPPTQFCLDRKLWDSELGIKGTDDNPEWQIFSAGDSTFSPKAKARPSKKVPKSTSKYQNKQKSKVMKVVSANHGFKSPFTKLVKVSAEILLQEWNGKETFGESDEDGDVIDSRLNKWSNQVSGPSKVAMKKVDYSIQKLRQCLTINTLQKASLQVALALLDVAEKKECRNPFLCLSQAAIFASQGPKGGNNDEQFKKPLPRETDCTAEEAIRILGRSDCLRSLHFTNEAMFLCSYAARVCCLHRDKKEPDHPWTPKWRVVGIMVYTISIGIDSTISCLMDGEEGKVVVESWDKTVQAEIDRGRSDALAMRKAFSRFNSSSKILSNTVARDEIDIADAHGNEEIKTENSPANEESESPWNADANDNEEIEPDNASVNEESESPWNEGELDNELYDEDLQEEVGDGNIDHDGNTLNVGTEYYPVENNQAPPIPALDIVQHEMDYSGIPAVEI